MPFGQAPVVKIDGQTLCQRICICKCIAQNYEMPLGQAPVVKIDGQTLCQRICICKCIAQNYAVRGLKVSPPGLSEVFQPVTLGWENQYRIMSKPKFYYFNAYGRGETARQLFVLAGVEFEDIRFEYDESWPALKADMPFGQAPVLKIDGQTLCQSICICKYIAQKYGLAGKTPLEDARMDMLAYTINDLRNPFRAVVLEKDPVIKEGLRRKYRDEQLPAWLRQFEDHLITNSGGDGYFVGDSISWIDVMFAANMMPVTYKNKCDIDLDLSPYPKLQALVTRVESHPRIAEWIKQRPVTVC